MEPSKQQNHDSNFAHEPQASKKQEKAPLPHPTPAWLGWQNQLPTPWLKEPETPFPLAGPGRAISSGKGTVNLWSWVPTKALLAYQLDLGIREHELVTGPLGEVPAPNSRESESNCRDGLLKNRSSEGKDTSALKRSSLKEPSPGASKPVSTWHSQGAAPKPVRTLNSSENEHMCKVVPIFKSSRGAGSWKHLEPTSRASPQEPPSSTGTAITKELSMGTSDTSSRRPHMSGPGAEEPRLPHSSSSMSGWSGKEALGQPRASFRKPSIKPLRDVPRQKPKENKVSQLTRP
ncbi:FH2 domain-containing protein 1 [Lemmus lemmus]